MSNKLKMNIFKDASAMRDHVILQQRRDIADLYLQWSEDIGVLADRYARKQTLSGPIQAQQLRELQRSLYMTGRQVSSDISKLITNNIYLISDAAVKTNRSWLKAIGFGNSNTLSAAFGSVPRNVIAKLITGQIYDSGWSLSQRIWSINQQIMQKAYEIVAGGMAQNQPVYQIAKNLEQYVSPSAKKPWNLTAADGRRIYPSQVDYNAQRLARTLAQHGYQQSLVELTKDNPFILRYKWVSNGSRVCPICQARNGELFEKDELPLDHPQGMCTIEPVVVEGLEARLANWFNDPDGTYPEIDQFAAKILKK